MNLESTPPAKKSFDVQFRQSEGDVDVPFSSLFNDASKTDPQYIKLGGTRYRAQSKTTAETPVINREWHHNESELAHNGMLIHLNPITTQPFIESLPQTLQLLIQETVTVIKRVKLKEPALYIFKFEKIDLNIALQYADNVLLITVNSEDINREHLKKLRQRIQSQFPDVDIDINLMDQQQFVSAFQAHVQSSSKKTKDEELRNNVS